MIIAKYELKQYVKSHLNVGAIIGMCALAMVLLLQPGLSNPELPSAQGLYTVGFRGDDEFITLLSGFSPFRLVRYQDTISLNNALAGQEIDAFIVVNDNRIGVYGTDSLRSQGALSRLQESLRVINDEYMSSAARANPGLEGILMPLDIKVFFEPIDYNQVINGSIDMQRKRFLAEKEAEGGASLSLAGRGSVSDSSFGVEVVQPEGEGVGGEIDLQEPIPLAEVIEEQPDAFAARTTLSNLPDELEVGFPFMNLLRDMMLMAPAIILAMLLALSLIREKMDKSLFTLFCAPTTKLDIFLGKSLPYLMLMAVITGIYGLYLGEGFNATKISFVFLSLSLLTIASSLFAVTISRSYRELTFVGSFFIFLFMFLVILPNVFAGINALALISPISSITALEQRASISWSEIFLSLIPYHFLSLSFFFFSLVCFDAEVLFSHYSIRSIASFFLLHLHKLVRSQIWYSVVTVFLLLPFVFLVESVFAYLILPLGDFSTITSLMAFSLIEEVTKVLPFLTLRTWQKRPLHPLKYGVVVGTTFFLAERLFNVYLISKAYQFLSSAYYVFIAKSLLATLAVHIITASLVAFIVRRFRSDVALLAGLLVAVIIHFVYNLQIVYYLV